MFEDLILIYWVDKHGTDVMSTEFCDFAEKLDESRYQPTGLVHCIDLLGSIEPRVQKWEGRTRSSWDPGPPTIYFGFQGQPGWTLPEFHDILNVMEQYTKSYKVFWLPDNWFDHPGIAPQLTSPENALDWLEQQIINDPPLDIKEVQNEGRSLQAPPF